MHHGTISDCATVASAPVKGGTRATTILHSQPPARRGNIVPVSFVIRDCTQAEILSFITAGNPNLATVKNRTVDHRDRMKHNATSGPAFSLYLSIVLLLVLVSVSGKVYAKRGCASFGHSCFGGHGKRFDSTLQHDTLQESISQNFQESEVPSPNDELFYVLPNDEFRERSDQPFMRTRKDVQQFELYPLSSLVDQWIVSHRRSHRTDK